MAKPQSTLEIQILVWYHSEINQFPRFNDDDVQTIIEKFCDLGIMEWRTEKPGEIKVYQDALDAYINAIMNVSLPTKVWIVPTEL